MALASGSDRANLSSLAGVQRVACLSLAQTGLLPVGARQPVINPNPVQAHAQVPSQQRILKRRSCQRPPELRILSNTCP